MDIRNILERFRKTFRDFCSEKRGNVAIIFGLMMIPLIGAIGAAVDYSRFNSVKADLQGALDSAALALSKEAATDTSSQLQTNALAFFNATFTRTGVTDVKVNTTYNSTGGYSLVLDGCVTVPTVIMGIMGFKSVQVCDTSTAKWGNTRLRVALVLDNTGSMAQDNKLPALKTATASLLTQLQKAVINPGDVYASIVPFVQDVNLGATNYNDSSIYWGTAAQDPTLSDNNSWDAKNGTCSISGKSPRSTCIAAGSCSNPGNNSQSSCTSSTGYCSKSQYTTQSNCTSHSGTWYVQAGVWTKGVWTPKNHNTWNGCVTDRGTSTAPGISAGPDQDATIATTYNPPETLFPAEQYSSCPQAIMGLSYDWTAMNTLVNNMVAAGYTNQPIGLVWGWQTLIGGGPFTAPAMDPAFKYQQVIILLSDGLNTADRWYSNQTDIDYRMLDPNGKGTCANIKNAGIMIYTIQVNTGGDPTSTLLQNCASNTPGTTDHFFMLTSAGEIVTTFNTIATNLTKLYLAY